MKFEIYRISESENLRKLLYRRFCDYYHPEYNLNVVNSYLKKAFINMKKVSTLLLITTLFIGSTYSQCPMCKTALTSARKEGVNKYDRQVGNGINKGILFLMSVPYVLVAGAGFAFYKSNQKKKTQSKPVRY